MNEQEFQKKYLPRIKKVLSFVLKSPYSDFYRKKYKGRIKPQKIKTYKDFQRIHSLTKKEIIETSLGKRLFIEKSKISHYTFTSGSTNKKLPTILAHSYLEDIVSKGGKYVFNEEELVNLGVKNFLVLFPPLAVIPIAINMTPRKFTVSVQSDTKNLKLTALIVKETSIQGIITSPTILYFFTKELTRINFDKSAIKWIRLTGEYCTTQKFDFFKSQFPNAKITFSYGSAELASGWLASGYQCKYMYNVSPSFYHINPIYMIETINDNQEIAAENEPGELIHTDLFPGRAFPLIRFKTGDIGTTERRKCRCANDLFFRLTGRKNFDILKFSGIILRSDIVEMALKDFNDILEPNFQMHVYEKSANGKIMPQLVLKLSLKENSIISENFKSEVIESVSDKLFLASQKNLKYFIDNKIFLPLEIEFVETEQTNETKTKNIISHL